MGCAREGAGGAPGCIISTRMPLSTASIVARAICTRGGAAAVVPRSLVRGPSTMATQATRSSSAGRSRVPMKSCSSRRGCV